MEAPVTFNMYIKTITYETGRDEPVSDREEFIGTTTLEQLHGWLSARDERIWQAHSPAPSLADK